ncbi:hypothetical protein JHK84_042860 [Glycine max]|nr:hypothetical protein JHK84_042860 [Glycine max]
MSLYGVQTLGRVIRCSDGRNLREMSGRGRGRGGRGGWGWGRGGGFNTFASQVPFDLFPE